MDLGKLNLALVCNRPMPLAWKGFLREEVCLEESLLLKEDTPDDH